MMIASLITFSHQTKSYIHEAWSSNDNHCVNCLISAIPVIGMIFLGMKEHAASKELLSSIKNGDVPKSIKLINIKNCHKLYLVIHVLVLGILTFPISPIIAIITPLAAIGRIDYIHRSHRVIESIQKPFHRFVVINNGPNETPRMRWILGEFWVDCAIVSPFHNQRFTVY